MRTHGARKAVWMLVPMLAATLAFGSLSVLPASAAETRDPTWNSINPTAGAQDTATYTDAGEIRLDVTASPGIGTRNTMSALGDRARLDVRDFTTTLSFESVSAGVTTLFSLQTLENGTLDSGGRQGSGLHVMIRMASETAYDWAVYEQKGDPALDFQLGGGSLDETKDIKIGFHYNAEENSTITIESGSTHITVTNGPSTGGTLTDSFDAHYAESDYKAWWNLSSYYMGSAPASAACVYIIRDINGQKPKAWHDRLASDAVTAFEEGVASLDGNSTAEEIDAVAKLNIFTEGSVWDTVLQNAGGDLKTRLDAAIEALTVFEQKTIFDEISANLDVFLARLGEYDADNLLSVRDTRLAYEAVDFDAIEKLPAMYKTQLDEKVAACRANENFPLFIAEEADHLFSEYEALIVGSDVGSLAEYKQLLTFANTWKQFVADNQLETGLGADDLAALDLRATALNDIAEKSFYSRFWTEGDSWRAELTENGLYATGLGDYGQTLGFNNKLTLGENASITFNIIYARRDLGSNHLHIGFYPKTGTATLGEEDGLRVDFWFSTAGNFEIRPVNGKTELPAFKGSAYLSVPDSGFFDPEDPDFEKGQYTVEAFVEDGVMMISVNGLAMPCENISPDLFKDGAYLTVSAMSYKGSDPNEIMITQAGGVNFVNYSPDSEGATPPAGGSEGNPGNTPAENAGTDYTAAIVLGAIDGVLAIALAVTIVLLIKRRKQN